MFLLKYGYLLLSVGVLAQQNSDKKEKEVLNNKKEEAVDSKKEEAKEKFSEILQCWKCTTFNLGEISANDTCMSPKDEKLKRPCGSKDKQGKCFSYLETKTANKTGEIIKQTLIRGCSIGFGGVNPDVKEKLKNGTLTEYCNNSEEKYKDGGLQLNKRCGSVCTTDLCNTDIPGESSGLSTGAIVGIVCGSVFGLVLIIGIVVYFLKKPGYQQPPEQQGMEVIGYE